MKTPQTAFELQSRLFRIGMRMTFGFTEKKVAAGGSTDGLRGAALAHQLEAHHGQKTSQPELADYTSPRYTPDYSFYQDPRYRALKATMELTS